MISAVNLASVWAVALRPTGPAATSPSPPSVNWLESKRSAPRLLQNDVGFRSADLKADASTFHANRARSGPIASSLAAGDGPFPILGPDDECAFFQARHNYNAMGFLEQILRY